MADATTTVLAAQGSGPPDKTLYKATGGRRVMLSFAFLLLLPFFASLPMMLYQRISHNLWNDALPLAVLAMAFAGIMFLIVVELTQALRSRIELGEESVKIRLPLPRKGPTPLLRYTSMDLPYDQIAGVELRREIYGGSIAPVMLKSARIRTKDDKVIPLGLVSEANVDAAFPLPVIAQQIADRAGLPLIDEGSVWRTMRRLRKQVDPQTLAATGGLAAMTVVSEDDIGKLNASHKRLVLGVVNVLVALMLVGIALDFMAEADAGKTSSSISKAAVATPAAVPKKPK